MLRALSVAFVCCVPWLLTPGAWANPEENPHHAAQSDYNALCVACHGPHLEGAEGPSLRDHETMHGGSREQIIVSIAQGYPEKAMPGWGPILGEEKIAALADFILASRIGLGPVTAEMAQVPGIQKLPDFSQLTFDKTVTLKDGLLDLAVFEQGDDYAARFTGTLQAPQTGTYVFQMAGDDGVRLLIDGKTLMTHDGIHGAELKQQSVKLSQGAHAFELQYFNADGDQALNLTWQGPTLPEPQPLSQDVSYLNAQKETTALQVTGQQRLDRYLVVQHPPGSLSVGTPLGVHYAFDPQSLRLLHVWQGDYMDITRLHQKRGSAGTRLGTLLPSFQTPLQFTGQGLRLLAPRWRTNRRRC